MNDRLNQMLIFLEQDPNDSFTRYAVGLEYLSLKDYELAIRHFTTLLNQDSDYLATYYQLGGIYATLEQFDKAEEIYNSGIKVARKQADIHTLSELQFALDELESLR